MTSAVISYSYYFDIASSCLPAIDVVIICLAMISSITARWMLIATKRKLTALAGRPPLPLAYCAALVSIDWLLNAWLGKLHSGFDRVGFIFILILNICIDSCTRSGYRLMNYDTWYTHTLMSILAYKIRPAASAVISHDFSALNCLVLARRLCAAAKNAILAAPHEL